MLILCSAALLSGAQAASAQGILGTNLIANGNAEAGPAGTATTLVASIPSWTITGKANVLAYGQSGQLLLTNPAPPDHGFQYFAGTPYYVASIAQSIDVSSGASIINGGNVRFAAAAFLGTGGNDGYRSQVAVAFQNANGQTFSSVTLGPGGYNGNGMSLQQQIGLVPAGTLRVTVTLTLDGTGGIPTWADSLALVFTQLASSPGLALGTNLVANGGAEAGPGAPDASATLYVPSWSTTGGASVCPYGGQGSIQLTNPVPVDHGVNLFCTYAYGSTMYQDIDVSAAATLIDASQVTYQVSAWLGATTTQAAGPTLTYVFYDWTGNQLAPTAQLGPTAPPSVGLFETYHANSLPAGTRRVRISIAFPDPRFVADDITFTLAAPTGPPVITAGGIVSASAFGGFTAIAPGTWVEIYGTDLSTTSRSWGSSDFNNGVGPTSLNGVSVSVGGVPAFIDFIGNGQVNALIPSNSPTGPVPITVSNANGTSDSFWLNVNQTEPGLLAPSVFNIGGKQYVGALFSDGVTFALPNNAIAGVPSRPAKAGDILTIYGIGFGPVSGGLTAGTIVSQQNSLTTPFQLSFGTAKATLNYDGLAPGFTGLYQFNVVVPTVATNSALPISFSLAGSKGSQTLYIAVQ
jgi:uncharacterized protein (TIGR03437 family)